MSGGNGRGMEAARARGESRRGDSAREVLRLMARRLESARDDLQACERMMAELLASPSLAELELPDGLPASPQQLDVFKLALQASCKLYGVTPAAVLGRGRGQRVVYCRELLAWGLRQEHIVYTDIGKLLGKDHSSMIWAVRRAEARRQTSPDYLRQTEEFLNCCRRMANDGARFERRE